MFHLYISKRSTVLDISVLRYMLLDDKMATPHGERGRGAVGYGVVPSQKCLIDPGRISE